jgi:hypothetical protein
MGNLLKSTRLTLEMIKWEHSIFALLFPFDGIKPQDSNGPA